MINLLSFFFFFYCYVIDLQLQNVLSRSAENAVQFEVEDGKLVLKCWWSIGDRKDIKLHTVLEAMEVISLNYVDSSCFYRYSKFG